MGYTPDNKFDRPSLYSPLTLAFIGDGVYEIYVRTRLLEGGNIPAHKLHVRAIAYVKAAAQAKSLRAIEPVLTEEEAAVYKRGRNAKSPTVPKNADLTEYRIATGFEALLGYVYLKGDEERLGELMRLSYDALTNENNG